MVHAARYVQNAGIKLFLCFFAEWKSDVSYARKWKWQPARFKLFMHGSSEEFLVKKLNMSDEAKGNIGN